MAKSYQFSLKKFEWIRDDIVLEILFISITIVPFLNLIDIAWYFTDRSFNEWEIIHTPIVIKLLKDFLLILLFMALILRKKFYSTWGKISMLLLFAIFIFSTSKAIIQKTPPLVILSGARWYLPLFLFPLFEQFYVERETLRDLYQRYRIVIFTALPLQIFQIFYSSRWNIQEGVMYSRGNGFFSQPQPMSLFALFFLVIIFEIVPEKNKKLNYFVVFVSIALTKSAAGVLGLGSLFWAKSNKKYKTIIGIVTLLAIATFPYITGRPDFWKSPLTRFKILTEVNINHTVFGAYSNACNTLQKIDPKMTACTIPDSFFTSSIGNLGQVLGLIVLIILLYFIYLSKKHYLFPIFILFLLSANLTEYFPLNILFPFAVGLKLNAGKKLKNASV